MLPRASPVTADQPMQGVVRGALRAEPERTLAARLPLTPPSRVGMLTTLQASLHAADRPVAPQEGLRHWASTRTVSNPSRQPATGPPDSYPDRTHTGKRRRARTADHPFTRPPPIPLGAQTKPHSPVVRATANRPIGNPIAGVQFDSRHGDGLKLWALFERAGDENVSTRVTGTLDGPIEIDDNDLNEGCASTDCMGPLDPDRADCPTVSRRLDPSPDGGLTAMRGGSSAGIDGHGPAVAVRAGTDLC